MDSLPLISVIVAIYNVEEYLRVCLDSLASQTYENIEFILVNDGSSDNSENICSEYLKKDSRFKLINQENMGLSAARNTGIDHAKGQYLGFVDGDDWVDSAMFRSLLDAAEKYHADVAACQFQYVYDDGSIKTDSAHLFCVSGEEAVRLLLRKEAIQDYVCNKLFAAPLFEGIRYPAGQVFEDISTTYKLFLRAAYVVSIPDANYYYVQRNSGIVRSEKLKNEIDCYFAKYGRYAELSGRFPDLIPELMTDFGHSAVKVWSLVWKERRTAKEQYAEALEEISLTIKRTYSEVRAYNRMGITGRIILSLVRVNRDWSYRICGQIHRIYRMKHPL